MWKRFSQDVRNSAKGNPFPGRCALETYLGKPLRLQLSGNECALGSAIPDQNLDVSWLADLNRYNDPNCARLKEAIAQRHAIASAQILVGNGIDGLLALFCRAVLDKGDVAVLAKGTYPTSHYFLQSRGANIIEVDYQDYRLDLDQMLSLAQQHSAKLVYLANPDNPTGIGLSGDTLIHFARQLSKDTLLILDEAYVEFMAAEKALDLSQPLPNTIRLRTFSKLYGLAGIRVGYAVAPEHIIKALRGIRCHYEVNTLSQEIATRALSNDEFVNSVLQYANSGRQFLKSLGQDLKLRTLPSDTNFVSYVFEAPESARSLHQALLEQGAATAYNPKLPNLLRVTIGLASECQKFAEMMAELYRKPVLQQTVF